MDSMSITELRRRLPEVIDGVEQTHNRVLVTRNGTVAAVMMSLDDYEGLEETLDILSSPETMAAIAEGEADIAAGRTYSIKDIRRELSARRKHSG